MDHIYIPLEKMIDFIILIFSIWLLWRLINGKTPKIVEGLNTFTGRLAIDDQYFYDKLFDDVYYYPNDSNGILGWERCKTECPGHCVEFGPTGNSYCFAR